MGQPYRLERRQLVRRPLTEVFSFYADPRNLARLTPPWLGFRLVSAGELRMREGLRIEYTIRAFGIRRRWTSEITAWQPPVRFVDEQVRGPYRLWRHLHEFWQVEGGTEIVDVVMYQLPLGPVGWLAHRLAIRRQLEEIFDYRARAVAELFGPAGTDRTAG